MEQFQKPWGFYIDIYRTNEVVFKKIVIRAGERISYQVHNERSEFWHIVKGSGLLKLCPIGAVDPLKNYSIEELEEGANIEIPAEWAHQIINDGKEDLVIFEMQTGHCREDDITRLEDPYAAQR